MGSSDNKVIRSDPIRSEHFRPLETAERYSGWLFYAGALLSCAPLLIDDATAPIAHRVTLVAFVLVVVAHFSLNTLSRVVLFPRAEDARRKDFLSHAFNVHIRHHRTNGYYSSTAADPYRRMMMSVLENLFFTKSILKAMAFPHRVRAIAYLVAWVGILAWRDTPLSWVTIAAQIIFSEQILARWLRLEWAHTRADRLFEQTFRLAQSTTAGNDLPAVAIDAFGDYESGKAAAGILLSERVFDRLNLSLTTEWTEIQRTLEGTFPDAD